MHPAVLPTVFATAASAGAYYFGACPAPQPGPDSIAVGSAIASIAGTMLGFMLAAMAVLASISHTHLVGMMHRTGHYHDLLLTLFIGSAMLLACLMLGYSVLFVQRMPHGIAVAAVGLHFGALASLVDVGRKFWLVLKNLRPGD